MIVRINSNLAKSANSLADKLKYLNLAEGYTITL